MRLPHRPGHRVEKRFNYSDYSPVQQALFDATVDAYYSVAYGFAHTRQPRPGVYIDAKAFKRWQEQVLREWNKEAMSQEGPISVESKSSPLTEKGFPPNVWLYWFQRCLAAKELQGKGFDD